MDLYCNAYDEGGNTIDSCDSLQREINEFFLEINLQDIQDMEVELYCQDDDISDIPITDEASLSTESYEEREREKGT